jgi:TonB family protein
LAAALVAFAVLVLEPGAAAAQLAPGTRQLNIDSFEYVWRTIRDRHFDPTLGGLDWQAVHDELRPKVENAQSIDEARGAMIDMISRLHQSHFAIIPADVYENIEAPVGKGDRGGSTGLKGYATAQVSATTTEASAAPEAQRSGKSAKAARTREEIELVFDKNKSAIYSLYSRALRENPALQGKVVLEVTIAPTGEVTECRVISSELGDPELERKLVARVKMFKFEDRDVAVMTTTKPIDFFPA